MRTIDYGGDKVSARILNLQMVVVILPDEVAVNVAAMTPARQKIWLGYWTADSKEHCSLQQSIPKVYATASKICTPRLVTNLKGGNGYSQVRANQDVVELLLLIRGICCE